MAWKKELASLASHMNPKSPFLPVAHYGMLVSIVLVGTVLRFWNLDAKPLWLDEVIGAIFSFGRDLSAVPLDQFFGWSALDSIFSLDAATCPQITQTVATDSVHPPVYFCLAHQWLRLWQPTNENWIWVLRSLPALMGVGCIAALYWLNRIAFSPVVGLAGAAIIAVSPFAVYLSQEARHYTLPMLFTFLSLAALVAMQHAITRRQRLNGSWLGLWAVLNSLGMYVHYFYILVVLAQVGSLLIVFIWMLRVAPLVPNSEDEASEKQGGKRLRQQAVQIGVTLIAMGVSYLPWLPTLISHFSRPETDWLKPYNPDWGDRIAPLYQTLSGWLLMVVAFPIEDQSQPIIIISALGMLLIGGWILVQTALGLRRLWQNELTLRPTLLLLGTFVGFVLIQFFAITYILDKDVTSVPRYNFVYYPGMASLIAAGLVYQGQHALVAAKPKSHSFTHPLSDSLTPLRPLTLTLTASLLSTLLVISGFVFHKGYYPDKVARDLAFEGDRPVILAVAYQSLQEVGLGLSFALELEKQYQHPDAPPIRMAFIKRPGGYGGVWRSLSRLNHEVPLPLNLWVVASPGMKTEDYPKTLKIRRPGRRARVECAIDPEQFNRIGFPYQLFRCR